MRVGVIGGGLMGSGIAEVCARSGVDVTVVEVDPERCERSQAAIDKSLDRGVRGGHVSEDDRTAALEHLAFTTSLDDVSGADAAIEAIIEDETLKREMFRRLDDLLPDAQFLASNTSSVPIMKLGAGTSQPHKVIGLHFFNPVPVLPLVEIVHSIMTADETADRARRPSGGLVGGHDRVHDLDQRQHGHRVEEVHPDHLVRLGRPRPELHDRHRGRVRGQELRVGQQLVEPPEHLALEPLVLDDRLDRRVGARDVLQRVVKASRSSARSGPPRTRGRRARPGPATC